MKMLRRILTALLIAALLAGALTVALAESTKFKTTGQCYLRAKADKNSKKLATIKKGKTFYGSKSKTDSRGVKWYYGKYNGKKGWVSSKNLRVDKKKNKDVKANVTFKTTAKCHLRTGPSLDSDLLDWIPQGKTFKATKYRKDDRGVKWYYGKYRGQKGWVSSKNLKKVVEKKKTATATAKPVDYSKFTAAEYYVRVTGKTINMRYEPSTASVKTAVYVEGDVLYALRTDGEWFEVLDEKTDRAGFISAKYLEKCAEEVKTEAAENEFENLAALSGAVEGAKLIDAPEGSANVHYSVETVDEKPVAQVTFVDEGVAYMLRCAPCATADDLADIDSDVSDVQDSELNETPEAEVNEEGTAAVVRWLDLDAATQYALVGPAAQEGALTLAMMQKLSAK